MSSATPDCPEKSGISLIKVNNEKELRLYNVDALARQISGQSAERQFPVYLVFHEGRPVGYFHAVQQLVIYPAIHPEMFKGPRQFMNVVKSLAIEMKRHAGNPLFMLCARARPVKERHKKLMRLRKADEDAYVYTED